jgi:aryl-alcohol dehydrogenase-like predicted oxidoreductase
MPSATSTAITAMPHRLLGQTTQQVPLICLGTMTWGEQNTAQEAHAQLDRAFELGVYFIDTAEVYPVPIMQATHARTETYIGQWLSSRNNRDQITLATKVAGVSKRINWLRGEQPGQVTGQPHRLDRRNIHQAIDASLKRLQTDYVDLYQLHWPDRDVNIFGQRDYVHNPNEPDFDLLDTLSALDELVKAGKVRHIGLSNETPWGTMNYLKLAEQHGLSRPVSVQNCYHLLNRSYEAAMAEVSIREHIGLLAYSPLAMGLLTGKYRGGQLPAGTRRALFNDYFDRYSGERPCQAIEAYAALANEAGLSLTQLALAFVNSRPFVTSTIIGATNLAQLEENIASAAIVLDEGVLKRIEAIHADLPNPCP